MFTGLVQGTGKVLQKRTTGQETRFTITPQYALEDIQLGESIAVNGVCLTVEAFDRTSFEAYASAETMSRTNLGALSTCSRVNMERAMAAGDRFGGHLVTGHIDCLATVETVRPIGQSRLFRLSFPEEFGLLVVPKGSVALDGISLTVNTCTATHLEVNIIPATWQETTLSLWQAGTAVNMETDIIGKYVQRMLSAWAGSVGTQSGSNIDMDFLRRHGF